jgi:Condensation domain
MTLHIEPESTRGMAAVVPLTYQQERLLDLEDSRPEYQRYHRQYAILELRGSIDRDALRNAVMNLFAKHPMLRFYVRGPKHARRAAFREMSEVEGLQESSVPEGVSPEKVFAEIIASATQPYDLSRGPLARAAAYWWSDERVWLLFCAHHVVFDYWSLGVVVADFGAAYRSSLTGTGCDTTGVTASTLEYAHWQRSTEFEELMTRQRPFWQALLKEPVARSELLFYPMLQGADATPDYTPADLAIRIPSHLAQAAQTVAREHSATLFMVLIAAFVVALRYFGANQRLLIATPVSGRTRKCDAALVGFISGFVPLVFDAPWELAVREHLHRTRKIVSGAIANQSVQFQEFDRLAGSPLPYQFVFQLQNAPMPEFQLGDLHVSPLAVDYGADYVDLALVLTQSAVVSGDTQGLAGKLTANDNLIRQDEASRIWTIYLSALEAMCADAGQTLEALIARIRNTT